MAYRKQIFSAILNSIEVIAVDACSILSALLGGAARRVFFEGPESWQFITTAFNIEEVYKYIPMVVKKTGKEPEELLLELALLPIEVAGEEEYKNMLPQARVIMAPVDPKDTQLLALYLHENADVVWSNDTDFSNLDEARRITTGEMVRMVEQAATGQLPLINDGASTTGQD